MNLYSVRVPRSEEDTEWYIVAETSQLAAQLYLTCVNQDHIGGDPEAIYEAKALYVDHVGEDAEGEPRWIDWFGDETITRRMMPYSKEEIDIQSFPEWDTLLTSIGFDEPDGPGM
jgi:hypothetical protein